MNVYMRVYFWKTSIYSIVSRDTRVLCRIYKFAENKVYTNKHLLLRRLSSYMVQLHATSTSFYSHICILIKENERDDYKELAMYNMATGST